MITYTIFASTPEWVLDVSVCPSRSTVSSSALSAPQELESMRYLVSWLVFRFGQWEAQQEQHGERGGRSGVYSLMASRRVSTGQVLLPSKAGTSVRCLPPQDSVLLGLLPPHTFRRRTDCTVPCAFPGHHPLPWKDSLD